MPAITATFISGLVLPPLSGTAHRKGSAGVLKLLCHEENIEEIEVSDFWKYRLIGLYEPGQYAGKMSCDNFDNVLIEDSLNEFMRDECLMVKADALETAPANSLVRSVMQIFDALPKRDAYVALISMRDDSVYSHEAPLNSQPLALHYYCEPIVPKNLCGSDDFSSQYVQGVKDALSQLYRKVGGTTLKSLVEPHLDK